MPNFPAFLSYVFITTFTPGPNNIMSMSNASQYGFKKALPFNFGVFFGFLIIFGICSFFSVSLYKFLPSIKPVMVYIGASYILWLAWKTYTSKEHTTRENIKSANTLLAGLLLQFVNVKVIIYAITIVTTFIVPYYNASYELVIFSLMLAFICFISTCCWSLFGSAFQKLFIKNTKTINIIMALLLVYCAVSLFH